LDPKKSLRNTLNSKKTLMSIQILILSGALNQTAIDLFKGQAKVIKRSVSAVSRFASSVDRPGMLESVIKMLTQTFLIGQQSMEM